METNCVKMNVTSCRPPWAQHADCHQTLAPCAKGHGQPHWNYVEAQTSETDPDPLNASARFHAALHALNLHPNAVVVEAGDEDASKTTMTNVNNNSTLPALPCCKTKPEMERTEHLDDCN